ncbi:natural killer enhancing factor [Tribonema minus]|uniref:thioredoxin-dependent peroxiredoxin n=1 Tax=Tribonema minus TaxID=303371 RepID=A0A836CJ15_9STRA|nr:natural killer enhancing factor [Tribonema minus]
MATVGKAAPDFTADALMPDKTFKKASDQFDQDAQNVLVSLKDYKGKYLVLFFWPLDHTFVCPTEIIQFSEAYEEFKKVDCELVGCSTDSEYCHLSWVEKPRKEGGIGAVNMPILADRALKVSKADRVLKVSQDYGVLIEGEGIALRGLFIISDKGVVRHITINDLPVGRNAEEALRLVQAFQYTDKHGEVCPAGWKPGEKSMKADPTGSKEYFAGVEEAPAAAAAPPAAAAAAKKGAKAAPAKPEKAAEPAEAAADAKEPGRKKRKA